MNRHVFTLDRDHVELHVLLKLLALAPSGGAAKHLIADGLVRVDGEVETRKARKLKGGERVSCAGEEIEVVAGERDALPRA